MAGKMLISTWRYKRDSATQKLAKGSCAVAGNPIPVCLAELSAMPKFLLALMLGVLLSEKWLVSEARTPPYGVKLCGREFIRAVIFTCGGSRWRRAGNLSALLGGDPAEAFDATSLSNEWNPVHSSQQDPSDNYGSWQGRQSYALSEEPWPLDRGARDVMESLSNACCKWGCSKREISSLC
ncbi:relaxin-3 [Pantherophis guttatus]|uniref:Relaxin-3 n=1 Tax=Pantherophis guttatus TaxID=94885 RepID=A0A6P9DDJ2_PANGU|nr:relaxin-3 [Pantherophis guttatus]